MQQYLDLINQNSVLIIGAVFLIVLICRLSVLVKIITLSCLSFCFFAYYYPAEFNQVLGEYRQQASLGVFLISLLFTFLALIRFLKAGLVIGFWFTLAATLGFMFIPQQQLSEFIKGNNLAEYTESSQKIAKSYVSDLVSRSIIK